MSSSPGMPRKRPPTSAVADSTEQPAAARPRSGSSNGLAAAALPELRNEYSGWTVPAAAAPIADDGGPSAASAAAPATKADRIVFRGNFTPATFFDKYVAARRPVVLTDPEGPDDVWRGSAARWSSAFLRQVAGDGHVRVEHRDSDQSNFGRGQHSRMKFSEFLNIVEGGGDGRGSGAASRIYLTTQDLGVDDEGRPYLHATPCSQLLRAGEFPLRPMVLDTLVPMNYNIWIGNSSGTSCCASGQRDAEADGNGGARECSGGGGSSSGLHHDFHDNLYVLISGRKRFRLFSPADAARMYTVGRIARVHPNGRICYHHTGEADGDEVHADGSDQQARVAMEADLSRDRAEQAVSRAEADVAAGVPGAQEALDRAEEQLEDALQQAVLAEMGDVGESEGDDDNDDDNDDDDDDDDDDAAAIADETTGTNDANDAAAATSRGRASPPLKVTTTPDHFSRVDVDAPAADLARDFPLFPAARQLTVTLNAGEMLYLPAGWFHEVTSESVPPTTSPAAAAAGLGARGAGAPDGGGSGDDAAGPATTMPCHVAFNYWFHPPDGKSYDAPYTSDFWNWDWRKREAAGCDGGPPEGEL